MTPSVNALYNAYTLEPVKCKWIDELPPIPLVGWLESERFVAYDSVHLSILDALLNLEFMPEDGIFYTRLDDHEYPAPFFYTLGQLEDIGGRVAVPNYTILPENQKMAFDMFKALSQERDYYARHPFSYWVPRTTALFACSLRPPLIQNARLRSITYDEDGHVADLEFWVNPSYSTRVPTLYHKDIEPGVLKVKEKFNLFMSPEGDIIGYEKA